MQYNDKVDILSITRTQDALGSSTEEERVLHNDLPCRINWTKTIEGRMFGKETASIDGTMFCRVVSPAITDKHRIDMDGTLYEVLSVKNTDNKNKRLKIEFKRVK